MRTRAPWALWTPYDGLGGSSTTGSARKITLHTTEGDGLPNWGALRSVPHLTLNPATGQAWQHITFDRSGYALASPGSPHSPNINAGIVHVQIEIIGYSNRIPDYPQAWYDQLSEWLRWLCVELDVPPVFPFPFTGPDGYGTAGKVRQPWDRYAAASGIVGHSHAPGNDHWDPGDLPTQRLTLGDDMPLTEKDAQLVAREVLRGIEWAKSGEDDPQNLQSHITTLRRQVEATNTRTKQWDDIDGPRSASPRVPGWLLAVILVLVVLAGLVGYQLPV